VRQDSIPELKRGVRRARRVLYSTPYVSGAKTTSMIRSMTGYASVRHDVGDGHVQFEIKSLNHRGFDIHYHSSRSLSMLEVPTRELIQEQIKRGRIEVYMRGEVRLEGDAAVHARPDLASKYLQAIETVRERIPEPRPVRLEFLLNLPGVFEVEDVIVSTDELWGSVHEMVERGIAGLIAMKEREGENLEKELLKGLAEVEELTTEISDFRDAVLHEYREKMTERIREWLDKIDMDESRLIQEIAFFADRSDIREECVRLRSHVAQFRGLLEENKPESDSYKAIGRRLDFLCQEMFREANTTGAKSSSMQVIERMLRLKGQIDRLREQVQNVE
ncbi:MAG: YicC/YloC family endoribonuclease, partial [bacterium]